MTTTAKAFLGGEPVGSEDQLGSSPVYIADPSSANHKAAVVLVSDIFGWKARANRKYADALAESGFRAVLPDLFKGDNPPLEDRSKIPEWRTRHPIDKVARDLHALIKELNSQGYEKIGAIGFCWGGLHSAALASTDFVSCTVVNHGTALTTDVIEAIKKPAQFNCAENDGLLPLDKVEQYKSILEGKLGNASDFKVFKGQGHGWTVRPDENDPKSIAAAEDALKRAKSFFSKHLTSK